MILRTCLTSCLILTAVGWALGLDVLAPEDLKGTFNAPRLRWVGPSDWSFDVAGILTKYNSSNDVVNRLVLLDLNDFSDVEDLANRQALGILAYADNSPVDVPGLVNYLVDQMLPNTMIPVVAISIQTFDKLGAWLDQGLDVTIRITSNDVNEWDLTMQSGAMTFFSVFMSAFTMTCIVLAVYKLAMFVREKGCKESIPQTMLILEIIANTIRFFPSAVDPLQSRALLPYAVSQMFFTTSWPFVIIGLLLISFYWHELITKTSVKINSFLSKLRIPFWCIFAVLLAAEIAASVLRGQKFGLQAFLVVMGVCYIVIGVPCVIFYIVTGVRLTRTLGAMSDKVANSRRAKRLNSTSRHIYASAVGVIVWLIAVVIGGMTDLFWYPWGYFSLWLVVYASITFISLMHILALHEPNAPCSKSRTTSTEDKSDPSRTMTNKQLVQHRSQEISLNVTA